MSSSLGNTCLPERPQYLVDKNLFLDNFITSPATRSPTGWLTEMAGEGAWRTQCGLTRLVAGRPLVINSQLVALRDGICGENMGYAAFVCPHGQPWRTSRSLGDGTSSSFPAYCTALLAVFASALIAAASRSSRTLNVTRRESAVKKKKI